MNRIKNSSTQYATQMIFLQDHSVITFHQSKEKMLNAMKSAVANDNLSKKSQDANKKS